MLRALWSNGRAQATAPNPLLLCIYQGLFSLLFPVAVFSLYWRETLSMSITAMLTVQAGFGLVLALVEFPSGYVADRLGHRTAIVSGTLVVTFGWLVYALATGVAGVVLAEAVLGAGFALISGADSALLYESLKECGREQEFSLWYARMRTVAQCAEGVGALFAGVLFARSPRLPFVLEVVAFAAALVVALALVRPAPAPAPERGHLSQMLFIVRHTLQEQRSLRAIVTTAVSFSLMSFLPVWLIALHAQQRGIAAEWIGPFWAGANFVIAVGSQLSGRLEREAGLSGVLFVCVALALAGYALLAFAPGLLSPFGYYLLTLVRGLHAPPLHHIEQRAVPSGDRAGFLSFRNFLFRGSYVFLGPIIGFGVDHYGMQPTLVATGAFVACLLSVSVVLLRREGVLRGAAREVRERMR